MKDKVVIDPVDQMREVVEKYGRVLFHRTKDHKRRMDGPDGVSFEGVSLEDLLRSVLNIPKGCCNPDADHTEGVVYSRDPLIQQAEECMSTHLLGLDYMAGIFFVYRHTGSVKGAPVKDEDFRSALTKLFQT